MPLYVPVTQDVKATALSTRAPSALAVNAALNWSNNVFLEEYMTDADIALAKAGTPVNIDAALASMVTALPSQGGAIRLFSGNFEQSVALVITKPIKFKGGGNGFVANGGAPATIGTKIDWTGATHAVMLTFSDQNFGSWGSEDIWWNCNSIADKSICLDGSSGGFFRNNTLTLALGAVGAPSPALHLTDSIGNTTSWNTFINTRIDNTSIYAENIRLSGFAGLGNACWNTFINTAIGYDKDANAIVLGGCDNNTFVGVYENCGGVPGTGAGVLVDTSEQAGFPTNDRFYSLASSVNGWKQPNNTPNACSQIFGYSRDNGEPVPSVGTSNLVYTTSGAFVNGTTIGSIGRSGGNNFYVEFAAANTLAAQFIALPNAEPDVNYRVIVFCLQQVVPAIVGSVDNAGKTTGGFNFYLSSLPGGATSWAALIIRV